MTTTMDPVQMLLDDHRKVEQLYEQYQAAEGTQEGGQIARQILMELEVHSKIEEEVFYPAVQQESQDLQGVVNHSYEEHALVDRLVAELKAMDPTSDGFQAKMKTLMDNVMHHVEEEETKMLPQAQEQLANQTQDDLAEQMSNRKTQLKAQLGASA